MRNIITVCVASLLVIGTVRAQYPGYGGSYPGGYPGGGYGGGPGSSYGGYPGLYGGGVSPYLNMIGRGVSPSAAYYNFVRPYTGGTFGNAFAPQGGYGRAPFFSNQIPAYADEDVDIEKQLKGKLDEKGQLKVDLPPAGHPAGFMNTESYFGSPNGLQGFGAGRRPNQVGTPPRR